MPEAFPYTDVDNLLNSTSAAKSFLKTSGWLYPAVTTTDAGTTNRTLITAAIATTVAAGGGTVAITAPGTYLYTKAGANPYQSDSEYGFEITGNDVEIYIGVGVTLKLAANQCTDAGGLMFMFIWKNKNRIRIYGPGTLDLNSQNQPGFTRGYTQQQGGHVNTYATLAGGGNNYNYVEDLTLLNTFGNPVNMGQLGGSNQTISKYIYARRLKCSVWGEGLQFIGNQYCAMEDNILEDLGAIAFGDCYEMSNCLDYRVTGNQFIGTGTNGNAGSGLDNFGSQRGVVEGNIFDGANGVIDFADGPGATPCDLITVTGNVFRNSSAGISAPPSGRVSFNGNVWASVAPLSACIQALNTTAGSKMSFKGDTFDDCGMHIISAGQVEFSDCEMDGSTGYGIFFNQLAGGYVPTFRWLGGRINNTVSTVVGVQSIASTDFAPSAIFSKTDMTSNSAGLVTLTNDGSVRNVIFDDCVTNSTTDANRPPESLGTVAVNGTLTTQFTLMTLGTNKSLATVRVLARVTAVTGTPSVILRVGSSAGSYANVCSSQTLSPTVVGQVFSLTLATGAGPAGGATIAVDVTTAASTACKFQFSIEGEEQPEYYAAAVPTTTNVPSMVLFLPRESTYWQDTAGTTPAVIGDRVARWDTGAAGLPRASQGTAGSRPVRQSVGLQNFDSSSVMGLVDAGGSATSVPLTGDFTAYFTGSLDANNNGWYPAVNSTGQGGFLIAQGAGNITFMTDASQISVTFATLAVTASGNFLFRFTRTSGVVTLALSGRSTSYTVGTLAGTVTLNQIQNWLTPSGNTTHRNGNILVCNTALTSGGATDTLIRNYLYESSAVRLFT